MINIRENQKISDPKIFETQFFGTTNFLGNFQDLKFVFLKLQLFNVYSLINIFSFVNIFVNSNPTWNSI